MSDNLKNNSVSRRKVMGAATAAAAAAVASPAVAQAPAEINWRLTSSFPKSLKGCFAGVTRFAQRLAEMSDNKFKIQYFAPGEIVGGLQALDAVRSGTVECCHTAPYFYVGQDPTYAFGTALPFGLNTRQHTTWLLRAGGLDLLQAFFDKQSVFFVPLGNTCAQAGGWFRKEINSPADLKGLKMRIPGIGGQVLSRLGAVPQQIAPGDVYSALERGSIDAAELSGPYDDENAGFHNVAKFYYYPGWQEVSAGTCLFFNKEKWAALPPHYKAMVQAAAADGDREMIADYDMGNIGALRRLAAAGVQFRRFSPDVLDTIYKAAEAYLAEVSKSNAEFDKIYKGWSEFRKSANVWYSISETPNDTFIQRATRG